MAYPVDTADISEVIFSAFQELWEKNLKGRNNNWP
jgi:hypothetical protein